MALTHRLLILFLFTSVASATALSQERVVTLTSDTTWHRHAVDNAYMNKRIADAAEQYKQYAPIPRIAFFDVGYPKDKAEFDNLNGYAILLISALSQNRDELPLNKAYVAVDDKQIELKPIKKFAIRNDDLASQTVKTFGEYRIDTLYLFPVYLRFQPGELLIDFKINRTGMRLTAFDGSKPETLNMLPSTKPNTARSIEKAIQAFIKREYPGYVY